MIRTGSTLGEWRSGAVRILALAVVAFAGAIGCGSSETSNPGGGSGGSAAGGVAGNAGDMGGAAGFAGVFAGGGGVFAGGGGVFAGGGGVAGNAGVQGGAAGIAGVVAGGAGVAGVAGGAGAGMGGQGNGGATILEGGIYQPVPSNRVKINLGQTPWKFSKTDTANLQDPAFNDAAWKDVGIPHTWCDNESFVNKESGGPGPGCGGTGWYRKHFALDAKYSGRKIFVEFEGAHMGVQVYINGTLIPGNSAVNPNATHVVGFLPFVVDITKNAKFGAENVLAVRVGMDAGGFFNSPTFSYDFRFGQGSPGIFRPVYMHITDPVYVPLNVYSVVNNWGTYVATVSASDATAKIRVMTNVQNETAQSQNVTLTSKILDASAKEVLVMQNTQAVEAGKTFVFDQIGDIANPHLWYPANSTYGTPYMYRVFHVVQVGGVTVDTFESPLGIRTIVWATDDVDPMFKDKVPKKWFPYINGKKFYAWGSSGRYDYPALGTAVPEEQQWRDVKILVEGGNNLFRPGHSTGSPELTAACDAYGVMLAQPSGELEGNFATAQLTAGPTTTYKRTLKTEVHRDMIVRDRNNPSILMWEVSNGPIDPTFAAELKNNVEKVWDPVNTRAMSERGNGFPPVPAAEVVGCSSSGCEGGLANGAGKPAWNAEAWGGKRSARFAYDYELAFGGEYLRNWKNGRRAGAFGLANWYLAETPGEWGAFLEGGGTPRSFGAATNDFSRIPKLLYHMFRVAWIPYEYKPQIAIGHHWNRSGNVRVNVFANCPKVNLKINGASQGQKTPNPWDIAGDAIDQGSTVLSHQAWWDVTFAPGTLRAECLNATGTVVAFEEKVTAGPAAKIVLVVEPPLVKPSGEVFQIKANGSDAAFILAKVTDAEGKWVPTANNVITFAVSGPGEYRGGSDQFVTAGQGLGYHGPGDPNLQAEGGMCKIAVKSTFAPGVVTVTATAAGLTSATATFTTMAP